MSKLSLTPSIKDIQSLTRGITTRVLAKRLERERSNRSLRRNKTQFLSGTSIPNSIARSSLQDESLNVALQSDDDYSSGISPDSRISFSSGNESIKSIESINEAFNKYRKSFSKSRHSQVLLEKARQMSKSSRFANQSLEERYPRLISHPCLMHEKHRQSTVESIKKAIESASSKDKILVDADQFEKRFSYKRSKDFFDKVLESYQNWMQKKNKSKIVGGKTTRKKTVERQTSKPFSEVHIELQSNISS